MTSRYQISSLYNQREIEEVLTKRIQDYLLKQGYKRRYTLLNIIAVIAGILGLVSIGITHFKSKGLMPESFPVLYIGLTIFAIAWIIHTFYTDVVVGNAIALVKSRNGEDNIVIYGEFVAERGEYRLGKLETLSGYAGWWISVSKHLGNYSEIEIGRLFDTEGYLKRNVIDNLISSVLNGTTKKER